MAIHLLVSASTPNGAFTYLQYIVTGSGASATDYANNQYKFILDIYESGSSERLARIKQPPNLNTGSVFNPADLFQEYAVFDPVWEEPESVLSTGSLKNYTLQFGEQYGTSPSSSITVYPNLITKDIAIIPAIDNANDAKIGIFDNEIPLESEVLTNMPTNTNGTGNQVADDDWENIQYLELDDYMTLSSIHTGSVQEVSIACYDNNGNNLYDILHTFQSSSNPFEMHHVGVGPKNLLSIGATTPGISMSLALNNPSASYVNIRFDQAGTPQDIRYRLHPNYGSLPQSNTAENPTLYNKPIRCAEKTRFAWINEYGVYDYYSVYAPLRKSTEIEREQITESRINYWLGDTSFASIVSQKKEGRGLTDLYKKYKDIYQISTQYIPEVTANWMKFMFFSPSVYIQTDNGFVPIIITNSSYRVNTEQASNKLFQYNIEFVYSNARRSNNYVGKLEYDAQ